MKLAGNMTVPCALLIVTTLSSIGCRSTSSDEWPNSGSSSREQHTSVTESDLARPGDCAPAYETGAGDCVVGRAIGARLNQSAARRQTGRKTL